MQKEKLTREQFEELLSIKLDKKIYSKVWKNYPSSVFYYDIPCFDGSTDNIGIYTSELVYSLKNA